MLHLVANVTVRLQGTSQIFGIRVNMLLDLRPIFYFFQKPAPFNNNIIINNKNSNNNTVSITIEPTSLDPILTTPQTPETPETTSRSLSCGDDVTGRSARRERLSAGDSWPADDVSESGDAGISIVSEGQTPFAKFVSVL